MQPGKATAHDVAPLVFELTRAIRARRVHDAKHASVVEALRRCEAAWHRLPPHARALVLEVDETGLALPDGVRLDRARLPTSCARGSARAPGTPRDRALGHSPTRASSRGSIERARDASAEAVAHRARARPAVERGAQRASSRSTSPSSCAACRSSSAATTLASYNVTANRIDVCVDVLLRAKRSMDAYRAARRARAPRHRPRPALRRDPPRGRRAARPARAASDELLDAVIEQACGASGLASVQASQVLIAIGALAVPRLLRSLTESQGRRARARDAGPDRARRRGARAGRSTSSPRSSPIARAAPRACSARCRTRRACRSWPTRSRRPTAALAREAAQALVRIGDDAAVQALISGLGARRRGRRDLRGLSRQSAPPRGAARARGAGRRAQQARGERAPCRDREPRPDRQPRSARAPEAHPRPRAVLRRRARARPARGGGAGDRPDRRQLRRSKCSNAHARRGDPGRAPGLPGGAAAARRAAAKRENVTCVRRGRRRNRRLSSRSAHAGSRLRRGPHRRRDQRPHADCSPSRSRRSRHSAVTRRRWRGSPRS